MKPASKGTWGVRLLIHLCTALLGVLSFWLLGFLVSDIESIQGPNYADIESQLVDKSVVEKREGLTSESEELQRQINEKHEEQRLLGDSSQNLQNTMNQLLELQKLSLQKDVPMSESDKGNLSVSLASFLENQKNYQRLNQAIADLTAKKQALDAQARTLEQRIREMKVPAEREFESQSSAHRLKLAVYQLLILVPLFVVSVVLFVRKRRSAYVPVYFALACATFVKVALVVHEYFPSRFFKYVLLALLLAAVGKALIQLIRSVQFPKKDSLLKQYREAYERFLCPVCEYPIRTGPRKYLYWTRRTVNKVVPGIEAHGHETPYNCPSCGTAVFGECPSCHKIRHSLLEHCEHCGAEAAISVPVKA